MSLWEPPKGCSSLWPSPDRPVMHPYSVYLRPGVVQGSPVMRPPVYLPPGVSDASIYLPTSRSCTAISSDAFICLPLSRSCAVFSPPCRRGSTMCRFTTVNQLPLSAVCRTVLNPCPAGGNVHRAACFMCRLQVKTRLVSPLSLLIRSIRPRFSIIA